MKNTFLYIVILISLILISENASYAQGVSLSNTKGNITNNGTIRVKNGQVKDLPATLGGRIEFSDTVAVNTQQIPNLNYWQLIIKGAGMRPIRRDYQDQTLTVGDSLIMIGKTYVEVYEDNIHAKNAVENTTNVYGSKEIRLNGTEKAQDIIGDNHGKFPHLNIDNPNGVNIIRGGFTVDSSLTLTQGKLNNTNQNFNLRDSALITRYEKGSIESSPNFEGTIDVTYTGPGNRITTGVEIPDAKDKLQNLRVENSGGIVMSKDFQVNRSLYVGARIATEFDNDRRYVMTYTPALNPDFSMSPQAEIDGTIRRTFLTYNENMLFNNRFTWALFRTPENAGGITALNFRVKPKTYFNLPKATENKVERTFEIWAENTDINDTVKFVPSVDVGYAWRTEIDSANQDETNNLPPAELKLKRWNELDWVDISSSTTPQLSNDGKWYTASASNVDLLGKFVIGMDGGGNIQLMAKVYLEGPYYDSLMTTDLAKYNLLPRTPDDLYPYNLVQNRANVRATITSLENIVDWIVMEFKSETKQSQYIALLLQRDGNILNPAGDTLINITSMGIDSGSYHIGILHRNHLPVYTLNEYKLKSEYSGQKFDFTKTSDIYGKEGSLKAMDIKNGFILYGMVAGDVNGDNVIDEKDYEITWENRDFEFIRSIYDINMTGYINTKDINYPWNNRGRTANIP